MFHQPQEEEKEEEDEEEEEAQGNQTQGVWTVRRMFCNTCLTQLSVLFEESRARQLPFRLIEFVGVELSWCSRKVVR